jgi:hypothetical protein
METKKITYDTEFLEDGKTIDLISIGMVNMDTGEEFYAVSNEFDTARVAQDPWLMKNVMSSIDHIYFDTDPDTREPNLIVIDDAAMTRREIRQGVLDFVGNAIPEWWAWYGAYDHVALSQLFGRMVDLPYRFPFFTRDIRQLADTLGNPELPRQPKGLHNALDDAKHNLVKYNYLMELPNPGPEA